MWRSLARSGLIVSGCVLLGRIAGFVREVVLARTLGLGRPADLAVFALTLPDSITNLLLGGAVMGGAIGAVLIPEFKALQERNPPATRKLFIDATLLATLAFGILAAASVVFGPAVVTVLAPGLASADLPQALQLLRGSALAIPFAAMAAVSTAYLQARGRFTVAALGTVVLNTAIIAALVGWTHPEALAPLGIGVAVASALRWLSQAGNIAVLPPLAPGLPVWKNWTLTRELLARYLHALGSLGLLILAPILARSLASLHSQGSLAAVNYVHKIVELPMGIAASVLSMVLLPRFSELFIRNRTEESLRLLRQGCWLSWTLALPISLAMGWFSGPVVSFLFGRGAMKPDDVQRIAALSTWALSALPLLALNTLFFSVLSARGDTRRAFLAGIPLFASYVGAAWAGHALLGILGLVLAGVLLQAATTIAYGWILARHHGMNPFPGIVLRDLLVVTVAAAAGFAPLALIAGRSASPVRGFLFALAAGAAALGAALLPRYRTLPEGLRTLTRARE